MPATLRNLIQTKKPVADPRPGPTLERIRLAPDTSTARISSKYKTHEPYDKTDHTPLTDSNMGVFFTCYTEVEAVDFSIDKLYQIYPEIKVLLVSDGGSDYSHLSKKYPLLRATRDYDSRGFVPYIKKENFLEPAMQEQIVSSALEFLRRISLAMDYCDRQYLLIMEPDALVRGKLSMPKNAHVTGSLVNELPFPDLQKVLLSYPRGIEVPRYGATPTILKRDTFREVYQFVLDHPDVIGKLSRACHTFANYDILIPVVFALLGYQETFDPQIIECLRDPAWETSGRPLVHQFRICYPKPGSGYTGTHANGK